MYSVIAETTFSTKGERSTVGLEPLGVEIDKFSSIRVKLTPTYKVI